MAGVKVALVGIGNVGATFYKGLEYYSQGNNKVGLWHPKVAGLKPSDVKIVAAFDIDPLKVGSPLRDIGLASDAKRGSSKSNVIIQSGLLADGESLEGIQPSVAKPKEFSSMLEDSQADVLVNLISSGMEKTGLSYAKLALDASVSFVNATPAKLATSGSLWKSFAKEDLVIAGDDLLSQFGGTAFHKGMIDFMVERGVHVNKSYQLDVGGSTETKRTMDERIKLMKRSMKTESIGREAPYKFESVAGTTEYTDFLGDSRNSYYWMSSSGFMGSTIIMDLTLRTSDGANAGNVLLDIARAASKKPGKKGAEVISAYGFKNPPSKSGIREAYLDFVKMYC